jgi:hypothetical protein
MRQPQARASAAKTVEIAQHRIMEMSVTKTVRSAKHRIRKMTVKMGIVTHPRTLHLVLCTEMGAEIAHWEKS